MFIAKYIVEEFFSPISGLTHTIFVCLGSCIHATFLNGHVFYLIDTQLYRQRTVKFEI